MAADSVNAASRTTEQWTTEVASLQNQIQHLQGRLSWFEKYVFGPRSEKRPLGPTPDLLSLFPAPEAPAKTSPAVACAPNPGEASKEKHPRRRAWPKSLPRIIETLLPPEGSLTCSCCGIRKEKIGEDATESLERSPVQHFVRTVLRPKFACARCPEEGVVQHAAMHRFIEKGNIGDSVVAQVALDKYVNHMPLARQTKNYARMGIELPVSTMVGWLKAIAEGFGPVVEEMRRRIARGAIAYSDDTSIPVMTEERKGATRRGVMWLYSNGRDAVVFEYSASRGQEVPRNSLESFRGYLHSDGYAGYNALHRDGVLPVYCWAHARRKFLQAYESGDATAMRSLQLIGRLFLVERYAKRHGLPSLERTRLRQRVSSRIVAAMERHWRKVGLHVAPKSLMGEAIAYVLSRWDGFKRFLTSGRLALDNNLSERNLRRVVIGRKNYMFCGSDEGARRAAILYSLVATCDRVGLDPFKYLLHGLSLLALKPEVRPRDLLPHIVARTLNA